MKPKNFIQNRQVAREGGSIAGTARRKLGKKTGKKVLTKFDFPQGEIFYRENGEAYKDVAERVMPDILIEDDCESIGGEAEMTYPHIRADLKPKIKSIVVKEFQGIDFLPDSLEELKIHHTPGV